MFSIPKLLFFTVFAAIAGYMLYDTFEGPEATVVGHGKVVAKSQYSKKTVERPTRKMARGSLQYWQVKTPEALWIDCAKDCAETYRREVLDYWEARKQEETGHGGK